MDKIKKILWVCVIIGQLLTDANAITISDEEELGKEFIKYVEKNFEFIKDPLICRYVSNIGNHLVSVFPNQPFSFNFYIIKSDVYNAFAGPAGHIFIHSGLFEAMADEEELAGILSHEISHAICRHISQRIERSTRINLATLAGVVAGIFLGAGGAGAAANAVTVGAIAAGQSLSLSYSRDDEMQADQIGFKYLTAAGYSGKGLLTILKKIRAKQWFGPDQIPTYLTTHPASEERIAYISTMIERSGNETPQPSVPPRPFQIAHTRLATLYGDPQRILHQFQDAVGKSPDDPIANYGYALILVRNGNKKEAITYLKTALKQNPFDAHILSDLGRIYYLNGNYTDALISLEGATAIDPSHPIGLLFMGRTQLELGKYQEATSCFEKLISENPTDEEVYYFAGEAYGKLGMMSEAHYHLGIYYRKKRDYKNALFHLTRALNEGTADIHRQNEILSMLKEIRKDQMNEQQEIKSEQRQNRPPRNQFSGKG